MLAETISSVKQRKNNITPLSRRNKATSAPDSRLSRFLNSLQRWSDNFTSPNSCFIVTPCRHRTRAVWHNSIAHIIISEAVYTGCHAMTRLIPDSKLLPRSISDMLTLISNDFQQSACSCCVQCRHGVSLLLFCRHFSLFFFIHHLYLSVLARLMSIMCTDERSLLASWVDTPLTADWLQVCFCTDPTKFSKACLKKCIPYL